MKTDRFLLKVIPTKNILGHEEFDQNRSKDLIKKFKKNNILTDPIIVASLGDNHYLQLDGMNRLNCFKVLKIKNILCQVIDYNNQDLFDLSSWIHLFKANKNAFFKHIRKNKNLIIKKAEIDQIGPRYIKEKDYGRLITIVDKKEGSFLVMTGGNLVEKVRRINYIVSFYKDSINRSILPFSMTSRNIRLFFYEHPHLNFYDHPDTNLMVVFPNFTPQQIIEVVRSGTFVPAGITCHIIKGRCLNVNIPLDFFDNNKSDAQLNKKFDNFIKKKSVRVYEESTIHFE